jgi:hypothetical protein
MKKLLTVTVAALLIVGLAAATYAMEFKTSGFMRVRTALMVNTGDNLFPPATNFDSMDDTESYIDQRFRIKMDWIASEDVMACVFFEGDAEWWGGPDGTRNRLGYHSADRAGIEAKQFYIDFKVPGIAEFAPNRFRAGVQGFSIRSHVLLGVDAAGLRWQMDTGPVRWYWNYFKIGEEDIYQADDSDVYGVRALLSLPDFPVRPGVTFLYMNSNNYPAYSAAPDDDGEFYWLGANLDGKIGPVGFQTDFIYFGGEVDFSNPLTRDADYGGWLAWIDARLPLDILPGFEVGGTFMYATGNDLTDVAVSNDYNAYYIPPGSEANPNLGNVFWASPVHDVGLSRAGRSSTFANQERWYGGLWTIRADASFKPLDWLKVTGYGMYIGDNTDNGNSLPGLNGAYKTSGIPASGLRDDSDVGIEVGTFIDISVYKNLTYSIGAGWLFAGDALDVHNPTTNVTEEPDDPWAIVSCLMYKF